MLKPFGDHVLVRPLSKEEKTKSGLFLPESAQEKPQQGTILAVGTGKYINDQVVSFEDRGVKVGQVVMYKEWPKTEVKVDGEDLIVLESDSILGIVE